MLKVKNLTFEVNEEGKKRCLVNHISFDVQDGEMLVITGFSWMKRIFPVTISIIVPMRELAMHFSSHPALKV